MTTTAAAITEHSEKVGELDIFWRQAESRTDAPVLYLHGNPTHSGDWTAFLEQTGGVAVDLPGFGRSAKPANFEYSIGGYDRFLQSFITHLGWDRFSLVVHDWGGAGLATAIALRDRLERLVIIGAVPLLPGYRWHRIARVWRVPVLGELAMGFTTKAVFRYSTRESNVTPGPLPPSMIEMIWPYFDHGTQRAVLRLYRSAPPAVLAAAGKDLAKVSSPTLVLWGDKDPYLPTKFAHDYAALLPNAECEVLENAGHWVWLDRPEVVGRVVDFLQTGNNPQ